MKRKLMVVGTGGIGRRWLTEFLVPYYEQVEITALVDVNPAALDVGDALPSGCRVQKFLDIGEGVRRATADCCVVATPPAFHEEAILGAVERGMDVITEKPLADSWEKCQRIFDAVQARGARLQVIQNYRDTPRFQVFKNVLRSHRLGRVNTLALRFLGDYRRWGSWGGKSFRHEIDHAMLVEGAIHHLDLLRFIAGADARSVTGWEWNPPWSVSRGAFNAFFLFRMENDIVASYEASGTAAGQQNLWEEETLRAECENGALCLDTMDALTISTMSPDGTVSEERVDVPNSQPAPHVAQIGRFLAWLDGSEEPETSLRNNIASQAMIFASIEANRTQSVIDVSALAETAGGRSRPG